MVDSRLTYPTGAAVHVWAGGVTSSGFKVNADVTQTVEAARISVSANSDMSSPLYVSAYQVPTFSQGIQLGYKTVAFAISGLSPNTKYYYLLSFQDAASQGDIIRSLTTAPVAATAFSFADASCSDLYPTGAVKAQYSAPVFQAIAADAPAFLLHTGDLIYSDISLTSIGAQRDANARKFRDCLDADIMNRTVPIMYCLSDHDYGVNDCSLDSPNAAAIFANTQTVFGETVPAYPLPLPGYLAFTATYGLVRFIILDAYAASSYIGNVCLGATQLAWLQTQLNQAASDGMEWVFIAQGRTWTGGTNKGFSDSFPTERQAICDMIEGCSVPVCLLVGDAHAHAFDDGTNTAFSTDGFAFFPQILASGLLQIPSSGTGPYSWNGSTNIYDFGADGHRHSAYALITMSADNTSWSATIKGDPINSSTFAPTTIASASSTDATPAVSFDSTSMSVAHSLPLTVNLDKTWFGACSVNWAASDGQNGSVSFLPNKKRASFNVTFASAGSPTITLSGPSGCTISGTNPATVTVS